MDLAEFLLARIATDEDIARHAMEIPERFRIPADVQVVGDHAADGEWGRGGGPYFVADQDPKLMQIFGLPTEDEPDIAYRISVINAWDESEPAGGRYDIALVSPEHQWASRLIATWDPARVLAECSAKRDLILWARGAIRDAGTASLDIAPDGWSWPKWHAELIFGEVLRLLAQPYADHPDYREEWRI